MLTSTKTTSVTKLKSPSPLLDRKIEEIIAGLPAAFNKKVHSISEANAGIIVDYIIAMKTEINLSGNYKKSTIQALYSLTKYYDDKPFKEFTRADLIDFLDSYHKTETGSYR